MSKSETSDSSRSISFPIDHRSSKPSEIHEAFGEREADTQTDGRRFREGGRKGPSSSAGSQIHESHLSILKDKTSVLSSILLRRPHTPCILRLCTSIANRQPCLRLRLLRMQRSQTTHRRKRPQSGLRRRGRSGYCLTRPKACSNSTQSAGDSAKVNSGPPISALRNPRLPITPVNLSPKRS